MENVLHKKIVRIVPWKTLYVTQNNSFILSLKKLPLKPLFLIVWLDLLSFFLPAWM